METIDKYNSVSGFTHLDIFVGPKPPTLPPDYLLRKLTELDYDNGFIELLEQLTTTKPITHQQFMDRFLQIQKQSPSGYHIYVIEKRRFVLVDFFLLNQQNFSSIFLNVSTGRIVGTGTLVLEWKFIHSCGARGRIEDIVIDKSERGKHLGLSMNQYLVYIFGLFKVH